VKFKNEKYLLYISALGMVCTTLLIALGHNTFLTQLFVGLNALGIAGGSISTIKEVKSGRKEEER